MKSELPEGVELRFYVRNKTIIGLKSPRTGTMETVWDKLEIRL